MRADTYQLVKCILRFWLMDLIQKSSGKLTLWKRATAWTLILLFIKEDFLKGKISIFSIILYKDKYFLQKLGPNQIRAPPPHLAILWPDGEADSGRYWEWNGGHLRQRLGNHFITRAIFLLKLLKYIEYMNKQLKNPKDEQKYKQWQS